MSARPRLTVDLAALADNYRRLQARAPGAEIAAVVKADAYGLGLAAVATTLKRAGAKRFFVADAEEAVALERLLDGIAIYVLAGYAPGSEAAFASTAIRPVLNTEAQVRAFAAAGGGSAALQIDTGMTRLGVAPSALDGLGGALEAVDVEIVLSHLADADGPERAPSDAQRDVFEAVRRRFEGVPASLANSAGLFFGAPFHYDLCRPGIAVYGGNPTPGRPNPMAPVVTLDAQILQIHDVKAPVKVGYGRTFEAEAGARIATCAAGYADGLLRCAGNVATAHAGGVEVPFVGRVSMDLLALDVSAVPSLKEGDRVRLISGTDGIDRFAAATGTIAYEVLVRLGARVERHYLETTV